MKKFKKYYSLSVIVLFLVLLANCSSSGSNETEEEVIKFKPVITEINPISGSAGTPITITGTNFSNNSLDITVQFNGLNAEEITFSSTNQISTKVPNGATTGSVSVIISEQTAVGPVFTLNAALPAPTITSLSTLSGLEGSSVTIIGTNFSDSSGDNEVKFNAIIASIIASSSTEISAIVPTGTYTGPVSVTVSSQTVQTVTGPVFTIETPINFKIAFLADSDIGTNADAVLDLVKNEGANVVVHPGDLNYAEVPQSFEDNINGILGTNFPYFYCVGNHDDFVWNGASGYQSFLESRFQNIGISWQGQLGVLSSFAYQGISFVSAAPDEFGISTTAAGNYIRDEFENVSSIWKIAFWHKNQRLMQIGGKNDEAGWDVYEESRKAGAIIATGHEHSYSRTHEMSNFQTQTISSTNNTVNLIKDDPTTTGTDEGRSFGFVSGIGGVSLRDAESGLENNPWWANVYHTGNGSQYGALFGEFNYNGDATLARFYFKDIDGAVRDVFFVRSN